MSKKIIVCADGTWNDEDSSGGPTNVAKLHHAIQSTLIEGADQITCYVTGVGNHLRDRIRGGAFGYGISRNILEAYRFLVEHYDSGDLLYFFGFSRGAYTVRSLAGFIRNSGLLKKQYVNRIDEAFALYRNRSPSTGPTSDRARAFRDAYSHAPGIELIGVWDTVGSLGVPLPRLKILGWLSRFFGKDWQFHDTKLSSTVKYAYHGISIHEQRGTFVPTLWEKQDHSVDQKLEQVWFPGVHADVGGGYRASDLSDASLLWMANNAEQCGLTLRRNALTSALGIAPDPVGRLHNSYAFPFNVIDWMQLCFGGRPRQFDADAKYRASVSGTATDRFKFSPTTVWPTTFVEQLRASTKRIRDDLPGWYRGQQ